MPTLHTFGCSITQGFALADTIREQRDSTGRLLTDEEVGELDIPWEQIHLNQPSESAWPAELGRLLKFPVVNHARRGACFQQIARQTLEGRKAIQPTDTVIVMWTYLSRLSLVWPARTAVPYCTVVDPVQAWRTRILGFNRFFGLSNSRRQDDQELEDTKEYIEDAVKYTYLTPLGTYSRYYNSIVLQQTVAHSLAGTGARVIHLSVETEPVVQQLEQAAKDLPNSLQAPVCTTPVEQFYDLTVDYDACRVILDPTIPPAPNDMHPSEQHHRNFAQHVYTEYFT